MDFHRFIKGTIEQDQDLIDEEFKRIDNVYYKKLNPSHSLGQSISDSRDMGEVLNKYGIGLKNCKDTEQYTKLYKTIKHLQRKLPNISISARINDYFFQSDGYYSMMISVKPLGSLPKDAKVPITVTAKHGQIRPIIEGQIANLIAGIREGLYKHKQGDDQQNIPEKETAAERKPKKRGLRFR